MKKIALLAALFLTAGIAQAQSSVTLYGTLDGSVQYISKANGTDNVTAFADSAVAASIWGLRGNEDLGGGMKATFNFEGDVLINNGQSNSAGIFRRAANVGIGSNQFGQLDLGLKMNPLFVAGQNALPMNSNSVGLNTAIAMGFGSSFFIKNAVTYTTPEYAGWKAQAQWGLSNNIGQAQDGAVMSGAVMGNVVGADVRGAVSVRNSGGVASSANVGADQTIYLIGGKYPIGKFSVGADFIGTNTAGNLLNATAVGVAYQVTPAVGLGANFVTNTGGSKLYNVQARYTFSKRTQAYAQLGIAANGDSGGFRPVFVSSADNITGYTGVANTTQTAFGVGLIHSF